MDAKFYIKSLNSSPNGVGVEGNQKGLFTAYNTPSYIFIRREEGINEVDSGQVISIDELSKLKLQNSSSFNGEFLYKEIPITNDFSNIECNRAKINCSTGIEHSLIVKIKDSDIPFPSSIKDEFGDYYVILSFI